jgi:hypothetical protein
MVIEYKIKFEEDGVTITQSVNPGAANAKDEGGNGLEVPPDKGGNGLEVPPDKGGNGLEVPPDKGGNGLEVPPDKGGTGLGRGRLIAVVLGPLVIGNVGPARAATKRKGESVKNPAVAGPGTILPRREGGAVPPKPPTR